MAALNVSHSLYNSVYALMAIVSDCKEGYFGNGCTQK